MSILNLPQEVLRQLKDYLFSDASLSVLYEEFLRYPGPSYYYGDEIQEGRSSWRNFLSISNQPYWKNHIKKELLFLDLNRYYSLKFLHQSSFRQKILQLIRFPEQQITLNLSNCQISEFSESMGQSCEGLRYVDLSGNSFPALKGLSHVVELNLQDNPQLRNLSCLRQVRRLCIKNCTNIIHLPDLQGLEELNILGCKPLMDNSNCSRVKILMTEYYLQYGNLQMLQENCERLFLEQKDDPLPTELVTLPKITSLELQNIRHINTSYFPNLKKFTTEDVFQGTVTNLTSLRDLQLMDTKIEGTDLPFLPSIQTIRASNMIDATILPCLRYLYLSADYNTVIDCSLYAHLYTVDLSYSNVAGIGALGRVKYLSLRGCRNVINLTGLGQGNIEVDLADCTQINDVSMLGSVRKLNLEGCSFVKDITALSEVQYLNLKFCSQVSPYEVLGKQVQLNLTGHRELRDIDLFRLSKVMDLNISLCEQITDISMLLHVKKLTAHSCNGLMTANIFGDKVKVDLGYCQNLKQINLYDHVHALSIYRIVKQPIINVFGSLNCMVDSYHFLFDPHCREEDSNDRDYLGYVTDEEYQNADSGNDDDEDDEEDDGDDDDDDDGEDEHWQDIADDDGDEADY